VHRDPLHTARFDLIGRPPAFVFGFTGIKHSYRQLQENIELWIKHRQEQNLQTEMKALPAVIATQGCFAWRNAAPLALSNREMLGVGNDEAPIRLIVLQLLYLLNRRLNVTADGYGLKPNLKAYLSQFSPPRFEVGVGNVAEVLDLSNSEGGEKPFAEKTRSSFYVPAQDRAPNARAETEANASEPAAVKKDPEPAAKPPQPGPVAKAPDPAPAAKPPAPESKAEFDKPSPFASAPKPAAGEPAASPPPRSPAPVTPLGSAPIPMADADDADMPVPEMPADPEPEPEVAGAPATASNAIPPKPPVDIEFGDSDSVAGAENGDSPGETGFEQTVVIPPPDAAEKKTEPARNSTDAFIARVKEQLSASEAKKGETEQDSFTSTIPQ
ncbi:MAG: hypothetical protein MJE77_37860, partial [Proteobacteria bacterium]|nr:hypothetical protein [Pseudomonadota bacterium]